MQDSSQSADLPSLSPDVPEEQASSTGSHGAPAKPYVPGGLPQDPIASSQPPLGHSQVQSPATAADNDLIEKEWVLKAKEIVEKTRDNPYEQQKAIEKFKADYMKKRYNKTIRVTET